MIDIFLLAFFLIVAGSVVWSSASLAPWVPAKKQDLARIRRLAALDKGDVFYDLGSGDGRVALYMAKIAGVKSIGVELSIPFWLVSQGRRAFHLNLPVAFKCKNLYQENLSQADAVYFFSASSDKLAGRLKQKLETELKRGTKVISYVFPMPGWEPERIDKPHQNSNPIYFYRIL